MSPADPTTAGDFTRRFLLTDILHLQEAINATRQRVWSVQLEGFLEEAYIDVDGTIAGTLGECKEGMDIRFIIGMDAHAEVVGLGASGATG